VNQESRSPVWNEMTHKGEQSHTSETALKLLSNLSRNQEEVFFTRRRQSWQSHGLTAVSGRFTTRNCNPQSAVETN